MTQKTTEARLIHMSIGGPMRSIDVGKRTYLFEWHRYFGPTVLDHRGEVKEKQPPENSRFWDAAARWHKQGERVTEQGKCIWEPADGR